MKIYDVLVIGGGAAGMMAAGTAAANGARVVLCEKNPVLGKKIMITGKGRCNLTNYCDVPEMIENTPVNGRFLTNAFYQFDSFAAVNFFNSMGVPTKIERGNRVFPESDLAKDIVRALIKFISRNRVDVIHSSVIDLMKFGEIFAAKLNDEEVIRAKNVIVATGGKSYPLTGSNGDGYKFARAMGHKLTAFKPALVPISAHVIEKHQNISGSKSCAIKMLQGLSLKNVKITILDKDDKKVYDDFGEMLFTHFGISGPIILSASSHIRAIDKHKLIIDLKPALDEKKLDNRLLREFKEYSNTQLKNIMKHLLPSTLIPVILSLSGLKSETAANQITKKQRYALIFTLKNLTIPLIKFRPIREAIITSGGVDVSQINPRTMESKLLSGLYFAGEIIDCDAYTGGFNLQIAWSSGYAAGISCGNINGS